MLANRIRGMIAGLGSAQRARLAAGDRFAAFISYRHVEPDRRWAQWLHGALETYTIPRALRVSSEVKRVGRVFRDEEELAASPHLSRDIELALERSDWLVVVCSPRARGSAWVDAEIAHFHKLGRADRILSLLIEGEPVDAFPPSLLAARPEAGGTEPVRPEEPLAADIRTLQGASPRRRRRDAKLRLIAPILGRSFDELRRRDQDRQIRFAAAVAAISLVLLAAMSGLVILAEINRREAVRQAALAEERRKEAETQRAEAERRRAEAEEQRTLAEERRRDAAAQREDAQRRESLRLALRSRQEMAAGDSTEAISLALQGLPDPGVGVERPLVADTVGALVEALLQHRQTTIVPPDGKDRVNDVAVDPTGKLLLVGTSLGGLSLRELASGRLIHRFPEFSLVPEYSLFSPDGTMVAAIDRTVPRLFRASDGTEVVHLDRLPITLGPFDPSPFNELSFSPDGQYLASVVESGKVIVWHVQSGKLVAVLGTKAETLGYSLSWRPDSSQIMVNCETHVELFDTRTWKLLHKLNTDLQSVNRAWFGPFFPDSKDVVLIQGYDGLYYFEPDSGKEIPDWGKRQPQFDPASGEESPPPLDAPLAGSDDPEPGHSGRYVAVTTGDAREQGTSYDIRVYDVFTGGEWKLFRGDESAPKGKLISPGGKWLAVWFSGKNVIRLFSLDPGSSPTIELSFESELTSSAFTPDDRALILGFRDGAVKTIALENALEHAQKLEFQHIPESNLFSKSGTIGFNASQLRVFDLRNLSTLARLSEWRDLSNPSQIKPNDQRIILATSELEYLAVESNRYDVTLVDGRSGKIISELGNLGEMTGRPRSRMAINKTQGVIASGSAAGEVKLYELATGKLIRMFEGQNSAVMMMHVYNDNLFVTRAGGSIERWNINTGVHYGSFAVPIWTGLYYDALQSDDGRRLALHYGEKIILFDLEEFASVTWVDVGDDCRSKTFLAKGKALACDVDGWIRVLDSQTGAEIRKRDMSEGEIRNLNHDPAYQYLVVDSGGDEGEAVFSVVDAATLSPMATLRGSVASEVLRFFTTRGNFFIPSYRGAGMAPWAELADIKTLVQAGKAAIGLSGIAAAASSTP